MISGFLESAERRRSWLLETVEALVRAESPSTDKAAVDRCGALIASQLEALGGRPESLVQITVGNHIRARFGNSHEPPVLLLGHFDTVWSVGQLSRMPFREEEGRLYGPGIFDMKAGIAVAMLAVRLIAGSGSDLPIVMLWTTDEEIGSGTSRQLIEDEARRSRAVLVLEPSLPGGAVKTSRKGCGDFTLTVHGVAAHAGIDAVRGANAIHELAYQIECIQRLQDIERGVTVNVNMVEGGSRTNVIADQAHAAIDVRVPSADDARRIESALAGLAPRNPRTRLELSGGVGRPPLERAPHVLAVYAVARRVSEELGHALAEGATGGGSDGNFTAALGVPTLDGLGPQGDGAHALHEHVLVRDLTWRAAFLAGLLTTLCADQR